MEEDPLQRRVCFLTLIEPLEMVFSQYKETCEVLIYYPKIVGWGIKDVFKYIRNLLHTNIDVHSRRLIDEFLGYGVKYISKLQSRCANMTLADKSMYDRLLHQVTHKVGESEINYIKIFQNSQAL